MPVRVGVVVPPFAEGAKDGAPGRVLSSPRVRAAAVATCPRRGEIGGLPRGWMALASRTT